MILYHGSSRTLPIGDHLRTPTGRDDGDVLNGGAVYLVDDPAKCERYGTVYEVEAKGFITAYKTALAAVGRKKKARYVSGVFVAKPKDTQILRVFGSR